MNDKEKHSRELLKASKPLVYSKVVRYAEKWKSGESIAQVQLQYDYSCNFKCSHCYAVTLNHRKQRGLTPEDVKRLADEVDAMGLGHFVITGGEPLIFPDFDEIVSAIGKDRFYIVCDSNGWFLDESKAKHLKEIGVDKVQLSIDSLFSYEHDKFRNKPGSHSRCLAAIDACKKAGIRVIVQTVISKKRLHSEEFIGFLEFFNIDKGVPVFAIYAKPVGEWRGRMDLIIDKSDMEYMRNLEIEHEVFTHLTPSFDMNLGCIAIKRQISVTKYGDVMPCPFIHYSLGNIFDESFREIVERSMKLKEFHTDTCLVGEDREYINQYLERIGDSQLPIPYREE